jgi:hypothetical protein
MLMLKRAGLWKSLQLEKKNIVSCEPILLVMCTDRSHVGKTRLSLPFPNHNDVAWRTLFPKTLDE